MESLRDGSLIWGGLRGEQIIKDYFPTLNEFADGECHGKIC